MADAAGQRAVVIRSALEAEFVLRLAAGRPVLLLSAEGAAGFLGPRGWRALLARAAAVHPGVPFQDALCCGAAPGHALAALRAGCRILVLDGGAPGFAAVAGAAAEAGALLWPKRPPAFDPVGLDLRRPGPQARLAAWFDAPPMTGNAPQAMPPDINYLSAEKDTPPCA